MENIKNKIYKGSIIIFFRIISNEIYFLLVNNAQTGNTTFVGGAQEDNEQLEATAQREIKEELGVDPDQYVLQPTNVYHDFTFGENKKERSGAQGSYQVFLAKLADQVDIKPTSELKGAQWKNKKEVLEELSFPDLRKVFEEVLNTQNF